MLICDQTLQFKVFISFFQIDMWKINMETVKPWISQKITQMLGFEDDVVIAYVFNSLEEERVSHCFLQNLTQCFLTWGLHRHSDD